MADPIAASLPIKASLTPAIKYLLLCGCLIALITNGVRTSLGLFNTPISNAFEWNREIFALALALQNLAWGIGQPVMGAFADRFGAAKVLIAGGLVYAVGLLVMASVQTPTMLYLSAGVLVGFGLSGASFNLVMSALTRLVPPEKRAWAMGITMSSGSLGQFVFAPLGQGLMGASDWHTTLFIFSGVIFAVPVLTLPFLRHRVASPVQPAVSNAPIQSSTPSMPLTTMLKIALRHPSYGLLIAGFFVCGFHVAFILAHFPAYLKDVGISANIAALCIALIGLFNIAGSYGAGVLADRIPKKAVLAAIYLGRSIAIIALLMLPKTPVVALSFAAIMGVLWLSTVPPTSGLVSCMFGTQYVATLYGIVFLSHQIGAFVGIWTGGWVQTHWGSYDAIWWVSIALGVVAAALHLAIKEHAYHASE